MRRTLSLIVLALCCVTSVEAADHFDGPQTIDDPVGDIADFYVFLVTGRQSRRGVRAR